MPFNAIFWTFIIVDSKPFSFMILIVFNAIKQVMSQPVIPHSSVVAIHVHILLRITRLDKHDFNAFTYSPGGQQTADIFWAIITVHSLGSTTPFNELI